MNDSMTRSGKELLVASKQFARENRWRSWWCLISTIALLALLLAAASTDLPVYWRGAASMIAGLVMVRLFIIYHDYQHGAVLRKSRLGACLINLYGLLVLSPPSVWKHSHDHHHRNNSKSFGTNIGSFPVMTTTQYANASRWQRLGYVVLRHPMIIVLGYFTTFLWAMTLEPLLKKPKQHFDCAISLVLHFGLQALLFLHGFDTLLLTMWIPLFIASSLGSYLFYAQHNFPAAILIESPQWTYVDAALKSSSFMKMNRLMSWFTGNIGYHHVHHLNSRIPFYRLPEAMASMQELQSPGITTLRPRDVRACLRLKLWCQEKNRLVGFNGE